MGMFRDSNIDVNTLGPLRKIAFNVPNSIKAKMTIAARRVKKSSIFANDRSSLDSKLSSEYVFSVVFPTIAPPQGAMPGYSPRHRPYGQIFLFTKLGVLAISLLQALNQVGLAHQIRPYIWLPTYHKRVAHQLLETSLIQHSSI